MRAIYFNTITEKINNIKTLDGLSTEVNNGRNVWQETCVCARVCVRP